MNPSSSTPLFRLDRRLEADLGRELELPGKTDD
jgi:hypothetical protein